MHPLLIVLAALAALLIAAPLVRHLMEKPLSNAEWAQSFLDMLIELAGTDSYPTAGMGSESWFRRHMIIRYERISTYTVAMTIKNLELRAAVLQRLTEEKICFWQQSDNKFHVSLVLAGKTA